MHITVTALASSTAPASADSGSALSRNLSARDRAGLYSSPGLEAGQAAHIWHKAEHREASPAHRLIRRGKPAKVHRRPQAALNVAKTPRKGTTNALKAVKAAKGTKTIKSGKATKVEAAKATKATKAAKSLTSAARAVKAVERLKAGLVTGRVSPVLWRQHALFQNLRLPHQEAANRLRHAGLRWRSSGRCVNRHRSTCTSLDQVRLGTLWGIVDLKRRSGCPIVVTGGTETGHAHGPRSHGSGYKIDIEHNRCVDRFIRGKRSGAVRGDGAGLYHEYRPSGHTVYANEPSHWDIAFT
ncbi:hypothetical protein [Sphaerisporangium aureirubrum]|uniref:Peptidase M15B domain-containing protein n=1 Tax=Sphaerisporangium aureirubrum TaxID=1544736 RepID=A0ABW1NSG2_9ACTN